MAKMERISFAGRVYTRTDVEKMREQLIGWRDESMDQWPDAIPFTVGASHMIAFMHGVLDQYPGEDSGPALDSLPEIARVLGHADSALDHIFAVHEGQITGSCLGGDLTSIGNWVRACRRRLEKVISR